MQERPQVASYPAILSWAHDLSRVIRKGFGKNALATAILCLTGCATVVVPPRPTASSRWDTEISLQDYPGAVGLLAGFDGAGDDEWRPGDRALFALSLTDGDEVQRWLLELKVIEPVHRNQTSKGPVPEETAVELKAQGTTWRMPSRVASVRLRVFDSSGKPMGESLTRVPRRALARGFADACRHAEVTGTGVRAGVPVDEVYLEAVASLLALFGIVEDDPALSQILWEVIAKPSILDVVLSMGVSVSLTPYFSRCRVVTEGLPALPTGPEYWTVPILIKVNDNAALSTRLLVADPVPPLHLSGGIVGMRGTHPGRKDLEFELQLLAAQLGEATSATAHAVSFPPDESR